MRLESGARVFDFGRSSTSSGTLHFKKQWGTELEPLAWTRFDQTVNGTPPLSSIHAGTPVWPGPGAGFLWRSPTASALTFGGASPTDSYVMLAYDDALATSWLPRRRVEIRTTDCAPALLVVVDTEEEFDWTAPSAGERSSDRDGRDRPRATDLRPRHPEAHLPRRLSRRDEPGGPSSPRVAVTEKGRPWRSPAPVGQPALRRRSRLPAHSLSRQPAAASCEAAKLRRPCRAHQRRSGSARALPGRPLRPRSAHAVGCSSRARVRRGSRRQPAVRFHRRRRPDYAGFTGRDPYWFGPTPDAPGSTRDRPYIGAAHRSRSPGLHVVGQRRASSGCAPSACCREPACSTGVMLSPEGTAVHRAGCA